MFEGISVKEAKKLARQQKKEADLLLQQAEDHGRKIVWDEGYPSRVNAYRAKIKEAGFEEILTVDSDLKISVSFHGDTATVMDIHFVFRSYDKKLEPTTDSEEFSHMMRLLQEYIDARSSHQKFLDDVKVFKDSLSKEQLKMIGYFHWVR